MKLQSIVFIVLICSANLNAQGQVDLHSQKWIKGAANCSESTDPPLQVVQFDRRTWIIRQNRCVNVEAPFIYLFLGSEKALLVDTGATESDEAFPLRKKVDSIVGEWESLNGQVNLIVAHSHKHPDHIAADKQFASRHRTKVVGLQVEDIINYFGISNWPTESVDFNLGDRQIEIIPTPGHEEASLSFYDTSTQILLTGDTFYPGRLYVENWEDYRQSISRLVNFVSDREVSYILGSHIEMSNSPGADYPMGSTFQPDEHPLPLSKQDLSELSEALERLGGNKKREIHDSFIITPIN